MCVYIAIIVIILRVTMWRVDSAPALKCNGGWNLGWQRTYRRAVYTGGEAQYVNVQGSVHCAGMHTRGVQPF